MLLTHPPNKADIVIIGAGVVGLSIARELSKYDVEVVVLEKEIDVGLELTSKNMGVIHPFIPQAKTKKFELCIKGNKLFDELSKELSFPFKRIGLLIVALNIVESIFLRIVKLWLRFHKINYISINKRKLREMEPYLVEKARYAIFVPTAGIIDPVAFTIALAENASMNGVKIVTDCVVKSIEREGEYYKIKTSKGIIHSKIVINAGGLESDEIMKMEGREKFELELGLGVMAIMDSRKIKHSHLVAEVPLRVDPRTKGGAAGITVYGQLIWGPNLREVKDKRDEKVLISDIEVILEKFGRLFPGISKEDIIFFFSGIRPASKNGDFIIGYGGSNRFINVAGIQSPGLTAAPAIAKEIIYLIEKSGLKLRKKEDFNPIRKPLETIKDMSLEKIKKRVDENASYRNIICDELPISEGEVLEAIRRGARSVKSVLNRLGLAWHPIIQSECSIRIAEILARELGISLKDVKIESHGTELGVEEL